MKAEVFLEKEMFPKNFLWGTATAAHQVEGNCKNNDFWEWEVDSKLVPDSKEATDQYNLYKSDFKLIKEVLHNNSYRLSIEWSRVMPEPGKINEEELKHYLDVFNELNKLKIEPLVTLHHFTNPIWFSKLGGWENKKNIKYFEQFAATVVERFKGDVNKWVIINEPNVYTAMAYLRGFWPPKKTKFRSAIKVYLNLVSAHKKTYKLIHKISPEAIVGSAINMTHFKGGLIAKILTSIVNYSFINLTKKYHDYIGINSYFYNPISLKKLFKLQKINKNNFLNMIYGRDLSMGTQAFPQTIYHNIISTHKKYNLPIIITENGIADKTDTIRPRYIKDTLIWLKQSINEEANVLGYYHWSLIDNIEWGLGKKARFGLIDVDYKNQKRTPKQSAYIYGEICKQNSVSQ